MLIAVERTDCFNLDLLYAFSLLLLYVLFHVILIAIFCSCAIVQVVLTTLLKVYVRGGLFEKSAELLAELEWAGYADDEVQSNLFSFLRENSENAPLCLTKVATEPNMW